MVGDDADGGEPFSGELELVRLVILEPALLFFGMIIATMGCYYGFRAEGGAEGVGRATTRAVVSSCLSILVLDYMLASILFRLIWT